MTVMIALESEVMVISRKEGRSVFCYFAFYYSAAIIATLKYLALVYSRQSLSAPLTIG